MAATYLPPHLFHKLFERDPLAIRLRPQNIYDPDLTAEIAGFRLPDGSEPPRPLLASLHLLNDDLKATHPIVEGLYYSGVYDADYQHGLTHIRDGDYGNARWWFRRLTHSEHALLPIAFASKSGEAISMKQAGQVAKEFVDACQEVGQGISPENVLEKELYKQMKAAAEWAIEVFVVKKQ
ncbi:hypothetical protein FRC09_001419 [Ceratobasidium sp. 395]|nr:hypothetical protein FRC09_001419 [Ceratobasidium sp. 395]